MELVLEPVWPAALGTEGLFPGAQGLSCVVKPFLYLEGRPGPCSRSHLWMGLDYVMEGEHLGDFKGPWVQTSLHPPKPCSLSLESTHPFPSIHCDQVVTFGLLASEKELVHNLVFKASSQRKVVLLEP